MSQKEKKGKKKNLLSENEGKEGGGGQRMNKGVI